MSLRILVTDDEQMARRRLQRLLGPDGPLVVFTTAHAEHAVDAFDGGAMDYVLEPIEGERLRKALDRCRERLGPTDAPPDRLARPPRGVRHGGRLAPGRPPPAAPVGGVMHHWSRREVLGGLVAALAVPAVARAVPDPRPDLEAERRALLEHARQAAMGFDVVALLAQVCDDLGLPKVYPEELTRILGPLKLVNGLDSVQALFELKGPARAQLLALGKRLGKDLRVKLKLRRMLRRAPQTAEGRRALIDRIGRYIGVDLDALRAHVGRYPAAEMVLAFGPVRQIQELVGLLFAEPFALYVQVAHGMRARISYTDDADAMKRLVRAFVDPDVRRVAVVGHGDWDDYVLTGWRAHPDRTLAYLCRMAHDDPKGLAKRLGSGKVAALLPGARWSEQVLLEDDLAGLAAALYPEGEVPYKELVVRYTCGTQRYRSDAKLLWLLLPDALKAHLDRRPAGFGPRTPADVRAFREGIGKWLADKHAAVRAAPGLGTAFVARPEDTRGYPGLAWLNHFVADPIPPYVPPAPFAD